MSPQTKIDSAIKSFLSEKIGIEEVDALSRDANLLLDGTLDSVSVMRLIAHIETELGIKIPPKDLVPKNFMTINAMATYLSQRTGPASAS